MDHNQNALPLPNPIKHVIFDYLDTNSLCNARLACRFFNQTALNTVRHRVKPHLAETYSFKKCIIKKTLYDLSVPIHRLDGIEGYSLTVSDNHNIQICHDINVTNSVIGVCLHQNKPGIFINYLDNNALYQALITIDSLGFLHLKALTEKQIRQLIFFDANNPGFTVSKQPWITIYPVDTQQLKKDFQTLCQQYKNQKNVQSLNKLLPQIKALPKEIATEILKVYPSRQPVTDAFHDKKCIMF